MENSSRHLPAGEARPGMVVADEVLDAQGHVLLQRGTVLTAAQLASLARHGIATLAVHDAVGDRLDHLFRKLDPGSADAWATRELRHYVAAYRHGGAR